MTRLRHYDHLNTARFVTFSCYKPRPVLVREKMVIESGQFLRSTYNWFAGRNDVPILMDEIDSPMKAT